MFAITTKVKIAAGVAAGVLTLGAAGAYAANANSTITVTDPKTITLGSGSNQLTLIPLDGNTTLNQPTFTNAGQCVSWLAQNKNIALAPKGTLSSSLKLSKNYHGKLMSQANAWCKTQVTGSTTSNSAETETPDATQSAAPSTDSSDNAGATHGHGHGHGRHAKQTD
jgi:hypothetical protein